jgi:hypothetical protein
MKQKRLTMTNRRQFLGSASLAAAVSTSSLAQVADTGKATSAVPAGIRVPKLELLYECDATLAPFEEFGKTSEGQRRIYPITGGTFKGPQIRGTVVSGGSDWNLIRDDGAITVEAPYYLRTHDGVLIRIVNKGVGAGGSPPVDAATGERFYMFTHPSFEAPGGKYDWLNRSMFVGTLGARKDTQNAVLIRVFRLV